MHAASQTHYRRLSSRHERGHLPRSIASPPILPILFILSDAWEWN
jgi:hypothetical protein